MSDYSGLHSALEKHIGELETKFIKPHLPTHPTMAPAAYDLDVRAFCVLSHAALEQYVEDIALSLALAAVKGWLQNKSVNRTLLGLLAFQMGRLAIDTNERKPEVSFYDHIRVSCEEAKNTFSDLLQTNNGVSAKYLRQMLLSVGLDVPDNVRWLGSLAQLANQRGENAHKSGVKKTPSPEDVKDWVKDCLEMCAFIRDAARVVLCRPAFEEDYRNYVV